MENHLTKITVDSSQTHDLGQQTQNERIQKIQTQIQEAKYFSIFLDCTPDISQKEQMSLIVRIVDLVPKPNIKEYFLGYMEEVDTTGLNMSTVLLDKLKELDILFDKTYDNEANMKAKKQGVQAMTASI